MDRNTAVAPTSRIEEYLKYGSYRTLHQYFFCPNCGWILSAGRNYHPNFCEHCGQALDFSDVTYQEDKYVD